MKARKMSLFVDESGRDPAGRLFTVGIIATLTTKKSVAESTLIEIEELSKKGKAKWQKAYYLYRERYIELLLIRKVPCEIFYCELTKKAAFRELMAEALLKILRNQTQKDDVITIFIDGATLKENQKLKRHLSPSIPLSRKVYLKTIRRDESSAIIRLADAICGLVRDAQEGKEWAQEMLKKLKDTNKMTQL